MYAMANTDELNQNKAAMTRIVDIFSTGDLSQVPAVIASDYLDHQGLGGTAVTGQQGFLQVVTVARAALPQLRVVIHDLIAEGDKVVARLQWHSTDSAGNKLDRETIEILRFVAGQAVEHWGAEAWASKNRVSGQAE
jgi:predicted SnoaL-like aldol condensation-catalyzing enzyme